MSTCICCGDYFKPNKFHSGLECPSCESVLPEPLDDELQVEVNILQNRSGRVRPVFDDEIDSHGF
jgi:Zn finger protein HypA/HybF involved in hydrogenase expression